jgi:hypothetical protein
MEGGGPGMTEERRDPKMLLADAIRRRDELNTFIKVLQEMIGGEVIQPGSTELTGAGEAPKVATAAVSDPASVVYPGMFFGKSQTQAAKLLLDQIKRPTKTRIISECFEKGGLKIGGKKPLVNLWGSLNRDKETFVLVPKAGWGLVDWYDPKVIEKMREAKGSDEEAENGNA